MRVEYVSVHLASTGMQNRGQGLPAVPYPGAQIARVATTTESGYDRSLQPDGR